MCHQNPQPRQSVLWVKYNTDESTKFYTRNVIFYTHTGHCIRYTDPVFILTPCQWHTHTLLYSCTVIDCSPSVTTISLSATIYPLAEIALTEKSLKHCITWTITSFGSYSHHIAYYASHVVHAILLSTSSPGVFILTWFLHSSQSVTLKLFFGICSARDFFTSSFLLF